MNRRSGNGFTRARDGRRRGTLAAAATLAAVALLATGCASSGGAAGAAPPPTPAPRTAVAHPGFDTYAYPGDSVLRLWRSASPYRWIGFYLPAPCHRETSWSGRRDAVEEMGWGVAVIYVGQQTWEGAAPAVPVAPPPSAADSARPPADSAGVPADSAAAAAASPACAPSQLTAARGSADGADAVARAAAEGFATGTTIFLDVERMERLPEEMRQYVRSWTRAVAGDARFRPGLYAHLRNAAELEALMRAELAAVAGSAGAPPDVPLWIASRTASDGTAFDLWARRPGDVGVPAAVWQGAFDVQERWGGVTLRIDQNVAAMPSPSAPPPPSPP